VASEKSHGHVAVLGMREDAGYSRTLLKKFKLSVLKIIKTRLIYILILHKAELKERISTYGIGSSSDDDCKTRRRHF
jgi:hypothetical protein